jgi:hypothetical protein
MTAHADVAALVARLRKLKSLVTTVHDRPLRLPPEEMDRILEEAASALEALERDARRLNDMEATKCYPFWNGSEWVYIIAADRSFKVDRRGAGKTVRAAIDAALAAA